MPRASVPSRSPNPPPAAHIRPLAPSDPQVLNLRKNACGAEGEQPCELQVDGRWTSTVVSTGGGNRPVRGPGRLTGRVGRGESAGRPKSAGRSRRGVLRQGGRGRGR